MSTPVDLAHGPAVPFPPVGLFILGFAAGLALDVLRPFALDFLMGSRLWFGGVLVVSGAGLATWACLAFMKMRTAIYPTARASQLVCVGPYCYTRNPMYVAMSLGYAGAAIAFALWWALAALPLVLIACYRLVVKREERYLAAEFGDAYLAYRRRVRRWL
jgi:protein-S-isoprenylcysteine O-methyltransferase Ste14